MFQLYQHDQSAGSLYEADYGIGSNHAFAEEVTYSEPWKLPIFDLVVAHMVLRMSGIWSRLSCLFLRGVHVMLAWLKFAMSFLRNSPTGYV